MQRSLIVLGTLLMVAIIATAGYAGFTSAQAQSATPLPAPPTVAVTPCDVRQTVTAPGTVTNLRETPIEMPMDGRLSEILVRPGDTVQAGAVLARLDNPERLESQVASAELDLLEARQALSTLRLNMPEELAQAELDLIDAEQDLKEAQRKRNNLDVEHPNAGEAVTGARQKLNQAERELGHAQAALSAVSRLDENHPKRRAALQELVAAQQRRDQAAATLNWYLSEPGQVEIDKAEANLALAQARYNQAKDAYEDQKQAEQGLAFARAEAVVRAAEAQLEAAREAYAQIELRAPYAGVVLEVKAQAGASIPAGSVILRLNDPQTVEVEATVIEEDYPYVEIGQPAQVFFDAVPDAEVEGQVTRIVPLRTSGDRPLYTIYISLNEVPPKVVAGMTADAEVILDERPGVLCLPRALVRSTAAGTAEVEVWADGQVVRRQVRTGLRGDTYVEIVSGLQAGELVVTR